MHPETPLDPKTTREAEQESADQPAAAARAEQIALFDHAANEWRWLEF